MHIPDVDLNLFVVFDAIYAEGGVSWACSRLNLTEPAVSHALGRLRLTFNDPLFVRRQHVTTPTPLAREIISTVRQSLNGFETTLNQTSLRSLNVRSWCKAAVAFACPRANCFLTKPCPILGHHIVPFTRAAVPAFVARERAQRGSAARYSPKCPSGRTT
jgi:hypothetical protein